jgi:hypothetical protein
MAVLNIPSIGTKLELSKDWLFSLHNEYRNDKFWDAYKAVHPDTEDRAKNISYLHDRPEQIIDCSLPKGTILSLDRIYVRKGKAGFDSVSFTINKCPIKGIKGRFWVKLEDANTLQYNG